MQVNPIGSTLTPVAVPGPVPEGAVYSSAPITVLMNLLFPFNVSRAVRWIGGAVGDRWWSTCTHQAQVDMSGCMRGFVRVGVVNCMCVRLHPSPCVGVHPACYLKQSWHACVPQAAVIACLHLPPCTRNLRLHVVEVQTVFAQRWVASHASARKGKGHLH